MVKFFTSISLTTLTTNKDHVQGEGRNSHHIGQIIWKSCFLQHAEAEKVR